MNNRQRGFSLIELLVVVALVGILAAIAFPSFTDWRRNMEYKSAARDIASILRDARQRAIATNREHRVEFDTANRRYRLTGGNLASGSTAWTVVKDWATLSASVNMSVAGATEKEFNPNGTSSTGSIAILDSSGTTRYTITLTPNIGRIRIDRG